MQSDRPIIATYLLPNPFAKRRGWNELFCFRGTEVEFQLKASLTVEDAGALTFAGVEGNFFFDVADQFRKLYDLVLGNGAFLPAVAVRFATQAVHEVRREDAQIASDIFLGLLLLAGGREDEHGFLPRLVEEPIE